MQRFICFLLVSFLFSFSAFAEEEASNNTLTQQWELQLQKIDEFEGSAVNLEKKLTELLEPVQKNIAATTKSTNSLLNVFHISQALPTEQLVLLAQLQRVSWLFSTDMDPVIRLRNTIKIELENIETLQKNVLEAEKETQGTPVASEELAYMQEYKKRIKYVRNILATTAKKADRLMQPGDDLIERLKTTISTIESNLPNVWKSYYFTKSYISAKVFTEPSIISNWAKSFASKLSSSYPQTKAEWYHYARIFTAVFGFLAVLGFFAYRSVRNYSDRWRTCLQSTITGAWVWIGTGISFLVASADSQSGFYLSFVFFGVLLIIWGFGKLSWQLRWAANPDVESIPFSLRLLFPPVALGVIALQADFPAKALSLTWCIILLVFLYVVRQANASTKENIKTLPLLEQVLYHCSLWFGLASLVVVIVGYPRLAILLLVLLFTLANFITLGSALSSLVVYWLGEKYNEETAPVLHVLLEALLLPVVWVVSLLSLLPGFLAVPGAKYFSQFLMQQGYVIGDVSFDFTKVFFVVILFLLFRSIVRVCQTSITQLPKRIRHFEKGVIPPLQTLTTYGFWAIFVLVALSVFGVSLTSVAVVAGGLSVGIGFGLQNVFNNLACGIMLIFEQSILIGDYVEVGNIGGTVKAIRIRSTTIETPDLSFVYVPNSTIMSGALVNWTRGSKRVRKTIEIPVAYGTDIELVTKLLLAAAEGQKYVLQKPAPSVSFSSFGTSNILISLFLFIDPFSESATTVSVVRASINQAFIENNITPPYSQVSTQVSV